MVKKMCAYRHLMSMVTVSLLSLPLLVVGQTAERPASDQLLPETTVAYIQIQNVRELVEKFRESNAGQMLQDERIAPLAQELYKSVTEAYSEVEESVGLSLEEIQSLPAGEICFAVVAPKRKNPAIVLIIDTDQESEAVDKALDRGRDLATEQGVEMETEETEEATFETFSVNDQKISLLRREGTILIGTDQDVLNDMVIRWDGGEVEKVRPLKENRKFITIMNRSRGTKEVAPDIRYFADPINLAKSATRGNAIAQAGLNFLPILGLDGFLGVGGAAIMDELDFESVSHMHILLANPRAGIFEMLALKPGKYEPQTWVPSDSVLYVSTSWDVGKAFNEFEKIYDSFNGEGALQDEIEEEINSEIDLDFKADIIDQLSGRVTFVQWIGETIAVNGQVAALGVGLKDPDAFMDTIKIILDKIREGAGEDGIEEVEYNGVTYWKRPDKDVEEDQQQVEEVVPVTIRVQQPCVAVIDDHLIICDSPEFIERAIDTARGKERPLSDDDQFQYVSQQMNKLLGTDVPGAVMYSRPEETMRMFFEVAQSDDTGEFLDEMAEENPFMAKVRDAMKDNPLPDFDEISHYFPPSGAFVTNDDTGYHILGFQLKSIEK